MRRQAVAPRAQVRSSTAVFPAPRKGWIRNTNLALSVKEGASVLDNWFPTATGIRIRKGRTKYATVGGGDPVRALFSYNIGSSETLFAATDTNIYDITVVADPDVSPSAAVTGLSSGDWSYAPIATAGGYFVRLVNGQDTSQIFDGATWATTPAITGVSSADLSAIWLFKQRFFFVEENTLNAWYLSVDTVGGAATKIPLGGVFRLGGALLFGATWSYDAAGDTGKTDACVFVTTEGEVAIYEGTNPASATDWALKGIYQIGKPLGKRAWFKSGGDLIIATDIGLIAVSQAVTVGKEALSSQAVSFPIEEEWKIESAARGFSTSWACELWPTKQMAVIGMPTAAAYDDHCFVVNLRTGAWARYTSWDVECLATKGDKLLFGTYAGTVMDAEVGGSDDGDIYTALYVGLYDDFGKPANLKITNLMRTTFLTQVITNRRLSVSADYVANVPPVPDVASITPTSSSWDSGIWDAPTSTWGDAVTKQAEQIWSSVSGAGVALAPCVQISIGSEVEPDIDLVRTDIQYETGSVVL